MAKKSVVRQPCLPPGWYPRSGEDARRFLDGLPKAVKNVPSLAAAAPHAGWFYSASLAVLAVSSLDASTDTVVVAGGHLPGGIGASSPPLFAMEDAAWTPLGDMEIDVELRGLLVQDLGGKPDLYPDNTVEVLLPMVRYFFPNAALLHLRLPGEAASFEAGQRIALRARELGRKLVFLGSTDLTHYGDNYGFSPHGHGREALDWVRNVNDRGFIQAVEAGDPAQVLERSLTGQAACSPGAVLGAMGFAGEAAPGATGKLLAYGTSVDASGGEIPASFVGYAAFAW